MQKKKTWLFVLLLLLVAASSSWVSISILSCYHKKLDRTPILQSTPEAAPATLSSPIRSKRFQLIKPLLLLGSQALSDQRMIQLQQAVNTLIEDKKKSQQIEDASVYIRDLSSSEEFAINDQLRFYPASLMKVNTLITLMIQADRDASFLSKKIQIAGSRQSVRSQTFQEQFKIQSGQTYTVQELIAAMIIDSDNLATATLHQVVNVSIFKQILADLEIPFTEVNNPDFGVSAAQYARLFRMLYNSAMISEEHAELAMEMLAQSKFEKGFKQGVPSNVVMVDKFGEHGTSPEKNPNGFRQLHECAIFYVDNKPYLLCAMTKGSKLEQLSATLGEISKLVYSERIRKTS